MEIIIWSLYLFIDYKITLIGNRNKSNAIKTNDKF